jgi:hypothetical protein
MVESACAGAPEQARSTSSQLVSLATAIVAASLRLANPSLAKDRVKKPSVKPATPRSMQRRVGDLSAVHFGGGADGAQYIIGLDAALLARRQHTGGWQALRHQQWGASALLFEFHHSRALPDAFGHRGLLPASRITGP